MVSDSLFLVCGLCSQVVDESMTIDDVSLRSFLIHMLSITNDDLPAKVCTDCFQGTAECKKFADRCGRAISKLKNTRLSDHMILGRSPRDKKQIESLEAEVEASSPVQNLDVSDFDSKKGPPPPRKAAKPGPASRKGPRAPDVSTDLIIDSPSGRRATRGAVIPDEPHAKSSKRPSRSSGAFENGHLEQLPGPRSSRKSGGGFEWERYPVTKSQFRSLAARRNQPKSVIAKVERALADQAYFSPTMSIDYRKRRQLATPVKTPARKAAPPPAKSRSAGPASRKRGRSSGGGMFGGSAADEEDPLALAAVPSAKKSRKSEPPARSSFGRVRKMRKGYAEAVDPFEAADEEDPLDVTPPRQRSPPVSKPKSKPQSAKAKAGTPGSKAKNKGPDYYYVDGAGKRAADPSNFDDVGSDEEEIFPSIGPYQCEICQQITHTKQEFVDHIKSNHKKVVDEEVLRSLEHDLKISRKKEMKASCHLRFRPQS